MKVGEEILKERVSVLIEEERKLVNSIIGLRAKIQELQELIEYAQADPEDAPGDLQASVEKIAKEMGSAL